MPRTKVVYYVEDDGTVPVVEWLTGLPRKARAKCQAYLARLQAEGHELRRPIADYLRDGIYELRPSQQGVQYRILYFFQGSEAVVISHGLAKKQEVPAAEIQRAARRMHRFQSDPGRHSFRPGLARGE
jgi:phage-related protein